MPRHGAIDSGGLWDTFILRIASNMYVLDVEINSVPLHWILKFWSTNSMYLVIFIIHTVNY